MTSRSAARDERRPKARLEELFVRHAAPAERLAYLLTGDRELAQDVTQEAFARIAVRLVHMRDHAALPGYLRQTVVNLCRGHFRKAAVEAAFRSKYAADQVAPAAAADTETSHAVRATLLSLNYRERAAIVLRYYVDLPDEETARILGCSRSTVRSLVARGLKKMEPQMEVGDD